LNHFFGQSSFAEYAVVAERTAVKVRPDAPLDVVCLLACGASTGIGAVLNALSGHLGARVAIFGCGGVGQSAILGARLLHASAIIAVDVLEGKLAMARDLGATGTVNAAQSDPVQAIRDLTGGGVDYSFELIGSPDATAQALAAVRTGGKTVLVGGPGGVIIPAGVTRGKTLTWTTGGNIVAGTQIPRLIDLYMAGVLPLDRLITRTYALDGINDAFAAMKAGEVARSVIRF
jgi:S-(hydroxymethyl)glutathione dehydrogenase/alcohol dehydrogenase